MSVVEIFVAGIVATIVFSMILAMAPWMGWALHFMISGIGNRE